MSFMRNSECGVRNDLTQQMLAASAMVIVFGAARVVAAERTWTRSEILAIADKEARRLGYDVEQMGVSFDAYNAQWGHYVTTYHEGVTGFKETPEGSKFAPLSDEEMQRTREEFSKGLENREYWAVYYGPLKPMLGGDRWVFIDRKTGDIIKTIGGK